MTWMGRAACFGEIKKMRIRFLIGKSEGQDHLED
jgi:hypothetical protein